MKNQTRRAGGGDSIVGETKIVVGRVQLVPVLGKLNHSGKGKFEARASNFGRLGLCGHRQLPPAGPSHMAWNPVELDPAERNLPVLSLSAETGSQRVDERMRRRTVEARSLSSSRNHVSELKFKRRGKPSDAGCSGRWLRLAELADIVPHTDDSQGG